MPPSSPENDRAQTLAARRRRRSVHGYVDKDLTRGRLRFVDAQMAVALDIDLVIPLRPQNLCSTQTRGEAHHRHSALRGSAKVDANKVKTHFSQHRPNVKSVSKTEVSVSVGVALPSAIVLYDLPPDIIVVEGGCPIKYFLWGDDTIVLVDSCTREVVELIAIA
jgi:hypothetical protein